MSSRTLDLFLVLGQQRAVRGLADPSAPTLRLFENNTYALRLNALKVTAGLTPFVATKWSEFASFEASLGVLDASPVSGKWKLKVQGETETTGALDFNITAGNLSTALNALAAVTAGGGVSVTLWNALANVFIVRAGNGTTDFTFEAAGNSLVPLCDIRIRKASDGGGSYTMVKLRQGYLAHAGGDDFVFPNPPAVTCTVTRVGGITANCLQLLSVPSGATGTLDLGHVGQKTTILNVATLKAATVQAALNGLFADGATNPRFACYDATDGASVQIECLGPLARTAVDALEVTMYGQVPLDSPVANFAITPLPIELRVSGKPTTDVVFELAGFDSGGNEITLLQQTATLVNTMLNAASSQAFAAVATKYTTVYQTTGGGDATIIGQRSARIVVAGSGTVPSAGAYEVVFTHDLSTVKPLITVWQLTDVSGAGSYRQLKSSEFDAQSHGNPAAVTLNFPFTPPTAGHVGALEVWATNLNAEVAINDHRYTTDAIDGVGGDAGRNLTAIIALLRAAMPSGWPTVPGSALADGSVDASKINLASLIAALMTPAGSGFSAFMTALRTDVQDATLISNFLTALSTSTQLTSQLSAFAKTILTKLNGTPELAAALQNTIATDPGLTQFFADLILSALADGATLKDAVLFTVPDFLLHLPNADTANGDLANGETDGFFPLPAAIFTTLTDDGNITDALPEPSSSLKGHYRTVAGQAYSFYRDFTDGQIVYCTGFEWFPGVIVSGKMFTTDGDAQLFTVEVNDKMLAAGTRFSVLAGLTLSQTGNCAGRWLLELKRGTVNAEASGTPGNISTISWDDTILSEQLIFDATAITHNFGFAVSRTALALAVTNSSTTVTCPSTALLAVGMGVAGTGIPAGALIASITNGTTFVLSVAATTSTTQTLSLFAATKTLYTTTGAATAPTSGSFVLGAFLSRLDTQNVTEPRGRITARMTGVKASIVKLTT